MDLTIPPPPERLQMPLFTVTGMAPTAVLDENGNDVDGLRIHFDVTGIGKQYVELPLKGLTLDIAESAIQDRVSLLLGILESPAPFVTLNQDGKPEIVP